MTTHPSLWQRATETDVVHGQAANYPCKSISSVDVHLRQLSRRMLVCDSLTEMAALQCDRDLLLERRQDLTAKEEA